MSAMFLPAFLLLFSNQPSTTHAFLHPNRITLKTSINRLELTKVWYMKEKETIGIITTVGSQDDPLNSQGTKDIPSLPWDNDIATHQIGDLEAFSNSETEDSVFTKVAQPSEMITHKHKHLIFRPAIQEITISSSSPSNAGTSTAEKQQQEALALVLLPGCFLDPIEYEALALAIQEKSTRPIWVVIPKLVLNAATPWTASHAIKECTEELNSLGYPSDSEVFIGGHSLGGVFLPEILQELDASDESNICGSIQLGSFITRKHRDTKKIEAHRRMPSLTVSGDLDGLIRTSRIAEDVEKSVLRPISTGLDEEQARLDHSVVLIPGMNHFQMINANIAHTLTKSRDLPAEISKEEAIAATAAVIADFMEVHQIRDGTSDRQKDSLLQKIKDTENYLEPMMKMMKLEGNHHLDTPCHLSDNEECMLSDNDEAQFDCDCSAGSSWVERMQRHLIPEEVQLENIADEFREAWYFNPFSDQPFCHPSVQSHGSKEDGRVNIETVSEAVYEGLDFLVDSGIFSNTALELRAKMNSPQAIWDALGKSVPHESGCNTCSKMNAMTIQYVLDNAPAIVKKRYMERGIKLQAGKDIEHSSGPSWIWSQLDYSQEGECGGDGDELCRIIDSHTMSTKIDHPIPAVGGKLYCKLLSPARVLEWIYTDSLR